MNLKEMQRIVEKFSIRINEICDNYNFPDTLKISNLIYAISYSEQFGFSSCNINCIMDHFNDLFVININMRDEGGNLILYAGISYY